MASMPLMGWSKTLHISCEKSRKPELTVGCEEEKASAQAAAMFERRLETNATLELSVGYVGNCWLKISKHWYKNWEQEPKSPKYLAGMGIYGSQGWKSDLGVGES